MKKPQDQEDRLTKFIVAGFIVILFLLCGIIAYLVVENSTTKDHVFRLENFVKNIKVYNGVDGSQGLQGVKGNDGDTGLKGDKGDTGETGPQGASIVGPKGDTGEQGAQGVPGDKGADGVTIFTRTNPLTGESECRYAGDNIWQPESECPQ